MELEKISENLEKMVSKFQGLQEQNNNNKSKSMFFKSKVEEAEEKVKKHTAELEGLGVDMQGDPKAQIEAEYEVLEKEYIECVSNVKSNQQIIEEVEKSLGSSII